MATIRIPNSYEPLPTQEAFHRSKARWKFYGGAMGGGKSKALCEEAYQAALDYPGIEILIARQEHTAITISTRKTMFREVLPAPLLKRCRIVKSGGFDFVEFPNGSVIHFVGLNDPVKFHSAEIGMVILDEAHQIDEDTVQTLNSRLRQKCRECLESKAKQCDHLPHTVLVAANPENPGHWLWRYFIGGAERTKWGYYKLELRLEEDSDPIGDSEFVQARATDNPYLSETYITQNLGGMKELHRRRYLEGEWLYLAGNCFFDVEALAEYEQTSPDPLYRFDFESQGFGGQARRRTHDLGHIRVYAEPQEGRSYAIGADVATGRGLDFSCAYVIDLANMDLCAEFHAKIDADLYAEQLHFLGRWYNTALLAVESAGGFGEAVIIPLRDGKGGRPAYPNLYRHQLDSSVDLAIVQRYGFPMTQKTRPLVLNQLEKAVREKALPFLPTLLAHECLTFCEFEEGTPSPRAQSGCNDDAVMAAAITLDMYRRKGHHPDRDARIKKRRAGRVRRKFTSYPWQKQAA